MAKCATCNQKLIGKENRNLTNHFDHNDCIKFLNKKIMKLEKAVMFINPEKPTHIAKV